MLLSPSPAELPPASFEATICSLQCASALSDGEEPVSPKRERQVAGPEQPGLLTRVAFRIWGVSLSCYEHTYHLPRDREIRRLLLMDLVADVHARTRDPGTIR